jgi:pimeloyl-ACP methyl ester carboxylesterase
MASSPRVESTGFTESDVSYMNGDVRLGAALLLPNGRGAFPAAVILQGSGASDRTNAWSRSWAEALASNGIAALLTDKRGTGKSGGDWQTVGLEPLARDGIAGVNYLRTLQSIRRNAVGVVGLSQGGHVAPLAATLSSDIAFVVDISGAATTMVEQVNHEMRNTFRKAGLDSSGVEAGMRLQALAGRYVTTGDWQSYHSAMQQALNSPLKPVAEGFPQTEDSWVWKFWRAVGEFDPIDHWKSLKAPALIMYGELDEQDNVPVAESVRRLEAIKEGRDLTVRVFEGTGHALFDQAAADHPLRADAVKLLIDWIRQRTR